jgi:hypothetical protein
MIILANDTVDIVEDDCDIVIINYYRPDLDLNQDREYQGLYSKMVLIRA